jgi:hypothetical protein
VQLVGDEILVFGGDAVYPSSAASSSALLYDPAADVWRSTGAMNLARWGASSVLLDDGRVLVTGGTSGNDIDTERTGSSEVYDPATGQWAATGDMIRTRTGPSLTRMLDGRVLAAGGYDGEDLGSAELWDPETGEWSDAGTFIPERRLHTAALLPSGDVMVIGGYWWLQLTSTVVYGCVE